MTPNLHAVRTRAHLDCGASRAWAWRSAHRSLVPNSLSWADWPLPHTISSPPSCSSQRLRAPQTWR